MKYLLALFLITSLMTAPLTFDFGTNCNNCDQWFVTLDVVMGGLSTGTLEQTDESIILKGEISLENNGGFASLRTPYKDFDLSDYKAVSIRYRSTGQDFAMTLNKYRRFWRPQYKTNLPMTNGEWKTITCNLIDFDTYRMDDKLDRHPNQQDLEKIIRLGLISNTKAATAYTFEVDKIVFE